ncbi:DUF1737 domain-containing protein [Micromonospora coerulea]|uniref:DUF1737 domain-containing protein n=1 Tax=Micromonospora coerulea TaxID=47856 RepID=UPI0019078966|nr:DUF1737 domain-containing protein [Micromonospora veneta]
MSDHSEPLGYRLITGPDDADFCARVSGLLDQGYRLYGSPALAFNGERVIAAQASCQTSPGPSRPRAAPDRGGRSWSPTERHGT